MSLLYSGIVVMGILIIAVVIYIASFIAWYAYRRHALLVAQENEGVKKEKFFPSMRWKPFLITFNILKKDISINESNCADDVEKGCGNQDCVVCLKVFEDGELVRQFPQCHHTFHADCIDKWLYSHSDSCPLCRSPINPVSSSRRDQTSTPENSSQHVSVDTDATKTSRAISVSYMPFVNLP